MLGSVSLIAALGRKQGDTQAMNLLSPKEE